MENDYATRTRNFDCISLGIPVIQNDDSFWAEIVTQHDAGTVLHAAGDIVAALRIYRDDRSLLARQSANIRRLQPHFSWSRIAADYNAAFSSTGGSQNKLFAGLYLLALLPATLVGFALFLRFRKQGGRMRPAG